jgi:membrane associated rhomboid family serine protease
MLTGAVTGESLLRGEWWRLLTCCFVHHGAMHLGLNMYGLWIVGRIAEQMWGRWRYLAIYLIAGFSGSCVAMYVQPDTVLAGASGAIWGIMASLPVWLLLNRAHLPRQLVSGMMSQLVTVLIINGVLSFLPGISWGAHFGGGIIGAIASALLNYQRFGPGIVRWAALLLVALMPVASVGALVRAENNNPKWLALKKKMQNGAEQRRRLNDESETDLFNEKVVSELKTATMKADEARIQTERLQRRPPAERPDADVQATLALISQAQTQIDESIKKIEQIGPFESNYVRSAVRSAIDFLLKWRVVLEKQERMLGDGAAWRQEDENDLRDAIEAKDRALDRYRSKLRREDGD